MSNDSRALQGTVTDSKEQLGRGGGGGGTSTTGWQRGRVGGQLTEGVQKRGGGVQVNESICCTMLCEADADKGTVAQWERLTCTDIPSGWYTISLEATCRDHALT